MQQSQSEPSCHGTPRSRALSPCLSAFTLIEILVVIAIVAILTALLFPVLSSAKSRSKQVGCANNLKQVALAFQMYAADNDGRLPENPPSGYSDTRWILGNMKDPNDATNESFLRQGKLFPYANDVAIYHCPADLSQAGKLQRLRSYSMNGWMGSRFMETNSRAFYRTFIRDNELAAAKPSTLWTLIDEHEATIDDGWFLVTMDDSKPFASAPATRHRNGYGVNFADGHVEGRKLRDPNSKLSESQHPRIDPKNSDWLQLKQSTTVR